MGGTDSGKREVWVYISQLWQTDGLQFVSEGWPFLPGGWNVTEMAGFSFNDTT